MHEQNKFKWTIIFLMKALHGQTRDMISVIDQLLLARKSHHVSIVICMNIDTNLVPQDYPRGKSAPANGMTTLFYQIENTSISLIAERADFDILDQSNVTCFFRETVIDHFPADQYALFTWDHGQPFGIFGGDDVKVENDKNPLSLHFRLYEAFPQLKHKANSFLTVDDLKILTITELRNAIEQSFGRQKIGVLAMSNCYLQFFDTGYELSACVEYLVGFETLMYFADPFDYKTILEAISRNPSLSPESLSKIIVSTFSYTTDPCRDNGFKRSVALLANDLSWYPSMAKQIDELAKTLIKQLPRYFAEINTALSRCAYVSPTIEIFALIDFRNFVNCLYSEAPALFPDHSFEIITTFLDKIVVASFIGPEFLNEASDDFKSPSCFSIYLPKTSGVYHSQFRDLYMCESGISPTEFVKRFTWDSFIAKFIGMTGDNPHSQSTTVSIGKQK